MCFSIDNVILLAHDLSHRQRRLRFLVDAAFRRGGMEWVCLLRMDRSGVAWFASCSGEDAKDAMIWKSDCGL